MGMSMASRQTASHAVFSSRRSIDLPDFRSETQVTLALVYLGLGPSALLVQTIKSIFTTLALSSVTGDNPFYKYRVLNSGRMRASAFDSRPWPSTRWVRDLGFLDRCPNASYLRLFPKKH